MGAYRATLIEALEIETFTKPLDLFIKRIVSLDLISISLKRPRKPS